MCNGRSLDRLSVAVPSPKAMTEAVTAGEKQARRKKNAKRRLIVYGSIVGLLWGFYVWQPWEFDFIARTAPKPNPPLDPESKTLFSPRARILVVTAHPDDDEFYIGGTLTKLGAAGAQLHLIVCTSGDKGYYLFENSEENRRVREAEQREASSNYKVRDITFLNKPDGRLRANDELVGDIRAQIERVKPNYILCFDGDYPPRLSHQDHRRSGDAALRAAKMSQLPLYVLRFSTIAANYVVDISNLWPEKARLLAIHRSQFHGDRLEKVTNMVESLAEEDGGKIGVQYGEGFHVTRF